MPSRYFTSITALKTGCNNLALPPNQLPNLLNPKRNPPRRLLKNLAPQQFPIQIAKTRAILRIDDPYLRNAHLRVVGQLATDLENGVFRRKYLENSDWGPRRNPFDR